MHTEQINHDPAHAFMNSGSIIKGRPWKQIGDFLAGLPVLAKFGKRTARFQNRVLQLGELLSLRKGLGERLSMDALQLRLVIEAFQMRGSARHAEMNDAFGPHRKVRRVDNALPAL